MHDATDTLKKLLPALDGALEEMNDSRESKEFLLAFLHDSRNGPCWCPYLHWAKDGYPGEHTEHCKRATALYSHLRRYPREVQAHLDKAVREIRRVHLEEDVSITGSRESMNVLMKEITERGDNFPGFSRGESGYVGTYRGIPVKIDPFMAPNRIVVKAGGRRQYEITLPYYLTASV